MKLFNGKNVSFHGVKEVKENLRNQSDLVLNRRFKVLGLLIIGVAIIMVGRLYITQIAQKDYYQTKLTQYNSNVFTTDSYRGSIYDRNDVRLVYNSTVNTATYYAVKGIKTEEIELIANFLVKNVNVDVSSVTLREKKDYLILKDSDFVDSLLTEAEKEELKSNSDALYRLKLEKLTEDILNDNLSETDVKFYKIYFSIYNCHAGSVVILDNLTVKEASVIGENASLLRGIKVTTDWKREYTHDSAFKSVLGRVTTQKQGLPLDQRDILVARGYNNDSRVGVSGIEQQYENILSGTGLSYSISYDTSGNPIVNTVANGVSGQNIRLTIDWEIQEALSEAVEAALLAHTGYNERFNNNIFVTMMDPNNGDIIAMVGKTRDSVDSEIYDYASGNYLMAFEIGSTFKGSTIYTAFKYNVISKNTYFLDAPIKIKDTPVKKSYKNLGNINEVQALSLSSNVYMFYIAIRLGGGTYSYDRPLNLDPGAFDIVRLSAGELGLGVKTGLDVPDESIGYRGSSRLPGNLLDMVIGQYDTYTTMQMAQYVSTIANGGKRIQPHLFLEAFVEDSTGDKITTIKNKVKVLDDVSEYKLAFERVQEGFIVGGTTGLARHVNSYYYAAGKTGTAQVIDYATGIDYSNRAYVGYAPYYNPQVAVACMAQRQYSNGSCNSLSKLAFTLYFDKYGLKSE